MSHALAALVVALILGCVPAGVAQGSGGTLDRSFNGDGKLLKPLPTMPTVTVIGGAVDSAGRIIVTGDDGGRVYLTRFLPDGSSDPGFGDGGETVASIDRRVFPESMTVDSKDRIIVAGVTGQYPDRYGDAFVMRFNSDGRPDPTFDGDGLVITGDLDLISPGAITVDDADRILVAGNESDYVRTDDTLVERFDVDGSVDVGFHANARTAGCGGYTKVSDMALDNEGRIVLVGAANWFDPDSNDRPLICRLLSDGRSDPSFSGDGEAIYKARDLTAEITSVAIDSRDRLLVSGSDGFGAARLHANGSLDQSFGDGGRTVMRMSRRELFPGSRSTNEIAVDDKDRPILSGTISEELQVPRFPMRDVFGFARLTTDGRPDRRFGRRGRKRIVFVKPSCPAKHACPRRLRGSAGGGEPLLYPGGRVLSIGEALKPSGHYLAIARLHLR